MGAAVVFIGAIVYAVADGFRQEAWTAHGERVAKNARPFVEHEKDIENLGVACAEGHGAVVFEEVRAHAGTLAAQVYGGFLAHLTAWCERKAAPYLGVPVATIKRHATGKGNAPKEDVIRAVRAQGFLPKDDNEADALALLAWAIANEIGGAE